VIYAGSCHCGEVTFAIDAEISELTTCDCSLCTKKNALMTKVHEAALTIKSGREKLSKYSWNERIAEHFSARNAAYTRFIASARRRPISASMSFASTTSTAVRSLSAPPKASG
jgi:hypothetical protein